MGDDAREPEESPAAYTGPERRDPEQTDRRTKPRGGRRAADLVRQVARFVHDLLTEPPR